MALRYTGATRSAETPSLELRHERSFAARDCMHHSPKTLAAQLVELWWWHSVQLFQRGQFSLMEASRAPGPWPHDGTRPDPEAVEGVGQQLMFRVAQERADSCITEARARGPLKHWRMRVHWAVEDEGTVPQRVVVGTQPDQSAGCNLQLLESDRQDNAIQQSTRRSYFAAVLGH